MTLAIQVIGTPAPQGSKRHVGHGVMIESSKKVKPWREAVTWAAREAMGATPAPFIAGPVTLTVSFYLEKPKSTSKKVTQAAKKPDLDKLLRSTLDALTSAGVWEDDSRVVSIAAFKRFAGVFNGYGLDVPGALICVEEVQP